MITTSDSGLNQNLLKKKKEKKNKDNFFTAREK